jgi:hypothetical protein
VSEYREIRLTQGQVTIVDAADFDWLNQWKWFARWSPGMQSFYATRNLPRVNGKQRHVDMHRVILGLGFGDPREGDHRDPLKTLDNRRSNLRIATSVQNQYNRRLNCTTGTGYKGVDYVKRTRKYRARITVNGTTVVCGYDSTPSGAHELYVAAAELLHGEFARV